MKVDEALEIVRHLKVHKELLQSRLPRQYCEDFFEQAEKIKEYNTEIERLTECIMNQEMDDSFALRESLGWIKESN